MGILAQKDLPFFPSHQEIKIFLVYLFFVHGLVAAIHSHAAGRIAGPDDVFSPVKVGQNIPPKSVCFDPPDSTSWKKGRWGSEIEAGDQGKGERRIDKKVSENQKGR